MKKLLVFLLALSVSAPAGAQNSTIYNPHTGKMDFVRTIITGPKSSR